MLVGFVFLESGKESNVMWTSEVCQIIFQDQKNMPKVIIIDRDTKLMNSIPKVFPTSYALFCRYHIIKNMIGRLKPPVRTKKIIMDVLNGITNYSSGELYVESIIRVCVTYPYFLKYVENIILD